MSQNQAAALRMMDKIERFYDPWKESFEIRIKDLFAKYPELKSASVIRDILRERNVKLPYVEQWIIRYL